MTTIVTITRNEAHYLSTLAYRVEKHASECEALLRQAQSALRDNRMQFNVTQYAVSVEQEYAKLQALREAAAWSLGAGDEDDARRIKHELAEAVLAGKVSYTQIAAGHAAGNTVTITF
jgi:hypothetical protein